MSQVRPSRLSKRLRNPPSHPRKKWRTNRRLKKNPPDHPEKKLRKKPAPPPEPVEAPAPKKRGRPNAEPKPKEAPRPRGRPRKEEPVEEERPPPTEAELQAYLRPLLQAYAAHAHMRGREAKRQHYRELFSRAF